MAINDDATIDRAGKICPMYRAFDFKQVISELSNVILDVKKYGAVGNANYFNTADKQWYADAGYTVAANDDTAAIQAVLSIDTDYIKGVVIPDGNYQINPYAKLHVSGNTKIEFSQNAKLVAKNTNQDISSMIDIRNVSNVELINPVIVGDKDSNTAITEGAGHGICAISVNNLKIAGANISKCFTDGIYLNDITNSVLENIICDGNGRQGMTFICGENVTIRNVISKNTNRIAPAAGIDIEPNYADEAIRNVLFENIYTENNLNAGISINLNRMDNAASVVDLTIKQFTDNGSRNAFVCTKYVGTVSESGTIKVSDMKSINAVESAVMVLGYKADGNPRLVIERPVIHNPNTSDGTNERTQTVALSIHTDTTGYPAGTVQGNVEIIEPTITIESGRTILRGMYIGHNNNFKNITIRDPIKIDIGGATNLSLNNTNNLVAFNAISDSNVVITDKYRALSHTFTGDVTLIKNHGGALYSNFILNTSSAYVLVTDFMRWDIADDFSITNLTNPSVSVVLPSTVVFINESNAVVIGTYSTTDVDAILSFKKVKDGMFRVTKEYGTWTIA